MSGKTSYAIFLSTLALFAALASHAKEPASSERSAVLSAVRAGNQAAYAKALERYNARLSVEFAPKSKPKPKAIRKLASISAVAQAKEISTNSVSVAHEETNLPDDSKKGLPSVKSEDPVMANLSESLKKNYQDCLKSGSPECCRPMIDSRASLPMACVNRDITSDGSSNAVSASVANSAM